jgi:DNA-binding NtrC family response regulator
MPTPAPDPSSTQRLSGLSSLLVREFFLDGAEGPDAGKSWGPLVPEVRVGSAPGNDVVLSDAAVSRHHFEIRRHPRGMLIADCGSKNGTFIGDTQVLEALLKEGSLIRAGTTALRVRVSGTARAIAMSTEGRFAGLLGDSTIMRALFATLAKLAPREVPVLIQGETGTGKELVARALHSESPRQAAPFVVFDCGAVSPTLIESELFGHLKGAFTNASAARTGAFEQASNGTLFLDEIGELPLALQPKLLRALEAGTIKPLGAEQERSVSVRVIAATHRSLRQMVNDGGFREDLYFRLAVFPVRVPPLRDRPEDVPLLAQHFLRRALGVETAPALDAETVARLRAHPWPGNVRELRNVVERAAIMGEPAAVERGDLIETLRELGVEERSDHAALTMEEARRRFEREYLLRLLSRHGADLAAAAAESDMHPKSLERLLRKHSLRREPKR